MAPVWDCAYPVLESVSPINVLSVESATPAAQDRWETPGTHPVFTVQTERFVKQPTGAARVLVFLLPEYARRTSALSVESATPAVQDRWATPGTHPVFTVQTVKFVKQRTEPARVLAYLLPEYAKPTSALSVESATPAALDRWATPQGTRPVYTVRTEKFVKQPMGAVWALASLLQEYARRTSALSVESAIPAAQDRWATPGTHPVYTVRTEKFVKQPMGAAWVLVFLRPEYARRTSAQSVESATPVALDRWATPRGTRPVPIAQTVKFVKQPTGQAWVLAFLRPGYARHTSELSVESATPAALGRWATHRGTRPVPIVQTVKFAKQPTGAAWVLAFLRPEYARRTSELSVESATPAAQDR